MPGGAMFAAAGIITTVQSGLFASLGVEIAGLAERVARVEREVVFSRGQLSLATPARAGRFGPGTDS